MAVRLPIPPMFWRTRPRWMAKEDVVEQRNERRALASGDHVCRAEVGDDRNSDFGGEQAGSPSCQEQASFFPRMGGLGW